MSSDRLFGEECGKTFVVLANTSNHTGTHLNAASSALIATPSIILWLLWFGIFFSTAASNHPIPDSNTSRNSKSERSIAIASRLQIQAAELRFLLLLPLISTFFSITLFLVRNKLLVHSTSWVQLIYKLLQTHLFYSSFCTALKYAMDHRHADVAAIFLSYRYTKYALAFPKIPVVLGRPYRSGISAVRAVKWAFCRTTS